MKEYLQLVPDDPKRSSCYLKKSNTFKSWFFPFFVSESNLKWFSELVEEPISNAGCGTELLYLSWSKKYNGVVIQLQEFHKEDENKDDFLAMKLDNFKEMIETWKKLKDQRAPNIYFIQEFNGGISVQENLDSPPKGLQNSQDKNFFRMVFDDQDDYWPYKKGSAILPKFELLFSLSKNYEPDYIINEFHKKYRKIEGNGTEIHWSQENNSVAIYSDDNEDDFFTMTFKNFKKMIEEWGNLYNKKAPEIYFIQEDDGTIIVRESLKKA